MKQKLPRRIKKLAKIVNRFTKKFDITAQFDSDFYAFPDYNTINFSIIKVADCDIIFYDCISKIFYKKTHCRLTYNPIDSFLFSILHEIGHCLTECFISEEERDFIDDYKEALDDKLASCNGHDKVWKYLNYDYYACQDEKLANEWAVDYFLTHKEECYKFIARVKKCLEKIYRGIES